VIRGIRPYAPYQRRLCAVATRVSVRAHCLRGQPVHCHPEKGTIIRTAVMTGE
jgi:hypothetical protein